MPPSAMIGTPLPLTPLAALVDRRDLRHADAGDDPRRADRPGPDADLDRVGPGLDQGLRPFGGGDVAGDHVDACSAS